MAEEFQKDVKISDISNSEELLFPNPTGQPSLEANTLVVHNSRDESIFSYRKICFVVENYVESVTFFKEVLESPIRSLLLKKEITVVYPTGDKGQFLEVENIIKSGNEVIVSVGGDESLNEVLNGVMTFAGRRESRPRVALAILPTGLLHNYSKLFGFKKNQPSLLEAIQCLLEGYFIPVDVGYCTYTSFSDRNVKENAYFLNQSCFGMSPSLELALKYAAQFNQAYPKGMKVAKTNHVKYKLDDMEPVAETSYWTAVCLGKFFAHSEMVHPEAFKQNGKFSICLLGHFAQNWERMDIDNMVKFGDHFKHNKVISLRGSCFSVTCELKMNVLVECDGILVGKLPARWILYPKEIDIIVPKAYFMCSRNK